MGINESSHSTELIDEARLAVRLVSKTTGDVIWSTTQESKGAKYKRANADAAGKVVKQLLPSLNVPIPLPQLPYGLRLDSLEAVPAGLAVCGSADDVVFHPQA